MKNRILSAIFAAVLLLSATACSTDTADGPITLTDQTGREITLDAPAEKVVSCYYVSSYAMMALGLSDRVIGIEKKADTRPIYAQSAPAFLELPAVGTMKECNVELIASLEPDLVVMPKKLADYADTLTGLGLDVLLVNPESHDELCQMLTLLGDACGVAENAEKLIRYYEDKTISLENLTKNAEEPTVYFAGNSSYLTVAPGDMYQSSLIDTAGGVNVASELTGGYWTDVSYEALLAYNPDVIILPSGADYDVDAVLADEQLAGLTAIENKAVYQMPGALEEWDSPIPSGILGSMWLTSVLHPNLYAANLFTGEATAFYEEFYGFTPAASMLK